MYLGTPLFRIHEHELHDYSRLERAQTRYRARHIVGPTLLMCESCFRVGSVMLVCDRCNLSTLCSGACAMVHVSSRCMATNRVVY